MSGKGQVNSVAAGREGDSPPDSDMAGPPNSVSWGQECV